MRLGLEDVLDQLAVRQARQRDHPLGDLRLPLARLGDSIVQHGKRIVSGYRRIFARVKHIEAACNLQALMTVFGFVGTSKWGRSPRFWVLSCRLACQRVDSPRS